MSPRHSGWQRITSISVSNHRFLDPGDLCLFRLVRERHEIGEENPQYSDAYSKIANFKKKPSEIRAKQSLKQYKDKACRQFAADLLELFGGLPASFALVPAVTSKCEADEEYDDRLMRVCSETAGHLPNVDCAPMLSLASSIPSSSETGSMRNPALILPYIKVNPLGDLSEYKFVFIVDDIITTGAHFKACQRAILETCAIRAGGVFWARAESPTRGPGREGPADLAGKRG